MSKAESLGETGRTGSQPLAGLVGVVVLVAVVTLAAPGALATDIGPTSTTTTTTRPTTTTTTTTTTTSTTTTTTRPTTTTTSTTTTTTRPTATTLLSDPGPTPTDPPLAADEPQAAPAGNEPLTSEPPSGSSTESVRTADGDDGPAGPQRTAGSPTSEASPSRQSAGRNSTGQALARQPDAVVTGAQHLTLVGLSGLQGRRNVIPLASECRGTTSARIEGLELPVTDVDDDPATFTLDAVDLALGTRAVTFDCGDDVEAAIDLTIYRQNGAERGAANSVAIVTGLGLASMMVVVGVPKLLGRGRVLRRRATRPPWLPPDPTPT